MHHEAHHSTTGEVLRTTREALARTGYALVGAGAWVLDAVRRETPPEELRHVGRRTAEWTRDGSRLAAEGFRTLTDHGRAVLPEPDRMREQARSAAEEAAAAARELADAGVDLIKTWAGMEERDIRAVREVADEAGLQIHSHLYHPDDMWGAIRAGTDVIQHAGSAGEYPYRDSLIRKIAHDGIPVVPTMAHRIWVVPSTNDFRTRLHDPELAEDFPEDILREVRASFERTEFHRLDYYATTPRQVRHAGMGAASQFIEANAVVAMGTDSGTPANFHTEAAWREIVAMVESGMSPQRAIVASTKVPAQVLGAFDEVGSIEPGKKADVVVVDGNPLRFVENLDHVLYVMKDGVVYEGSEH